MSKNLNLDWLHTDKQKGEKTKVKEDVNDTPEEKSKMKNKSPGLEKLKKENRKLKKKYNRLKHHELTEENMIQYFMGIKKTKLYELSRFFDLSAAHEIENLLKKLVKDRKIFRGKDNWYSINPKFKKTLGGTQN